MNVRARRNADVEGLRIREVEGRLTLGVGPVCKPLIAGDQMTLLEINYAPGAGAPPHVHDHETICYVVRGRVRTVIDGEEIELGPGDVCIHPRGVAHGIVGVEDALVIEIKSPAQPVAEFLALANDG